MGYTKEEFNEVTIATLNSRGDHISLNAVKMIEEMQEQLLIPCDHRCHSRNGRYMLYEGWCEKCGTNCNKT